MRLIVDMTEAEFGEALAAVQSRHVKTLASTTRRSGKQWIWTMVVAVVVAGVLQLFDRESWDVYPALRPPLYDSLLLFIPFIALLILAAATNAARQWGNKRLALIGIARALAPTLLIMGLLIFILYKLVSRPQPNPQSPQAGVIDSASGPDWLGTLYPQIPWLIAIFIVGLLVVRTQRRAIQQYWNTQPNLARPKTCELSAYGLVIDDGDAQRQYQWQAIHSFLETTNLLLLCPTAITFETLPKRCFATPDELAAARALIQHQMSLARPHSAFPVETSAPGSAPAPSPTPPPLPLPDPLARHPAAPADRA